MKFARPRPTSDQIIMYISNHSGSIVPKEVGIKAGCSLMFDEVAKKACHQKTKENGIE